MSIISLAQCVAIQRLLLSNSSFLVRLVELHILHIPRDGIAYSMIFIVSFGRQVQKASSGSTTEDSSDESDTDPNEGTNKLNTQSVGNPTITNKRGGESEESSDESEDLATPGHRGFPSLTTRTPLPSGNFLGRLPTFVCLMGFVFLLGLKSGGAR